MDDALRESVATKIDIRALEAKLTVRGAVGLTALFAALASIKFWG